MSSYLLEYMKIHLISLEQDLENALMGEGYENLEGQVIATRHFIEVGEEYANR